MSKTTAKESVEDKRFSVGTIQSYKSLSRNASRLLYEMIEYGTQRYKEFGETTHIMSFADVIGTFGLKMTKDRTYVKDKIAEIQNMKVVEWDFLGESQEILERIKEASRDQLDQLLKQTSFQSIVNTEHFQLLNAERIYLVNSGKAKTEQHKKIVDEILDLLYPIYVGNKSIFEAFDLHKSKISFSFNRHLMNEFMNPIAYGILDRRIILQLRSQYSMALYANGCVYRYQKSTKWLTIEETKKMFGVEQTVDANGDLKFRYNTYAPFKQGVIKVAIDECNKLHSERKLPFYIELEEDNKQTPGKAVDALRFHFFSDENLELPIFGIMSTLDDSDKSLTKSQLTHIKEEAIALGCMPEVAGNVIESACRNRGATYNDLLETIAYCKSQAEKKISKGEEITGGYIRNAIEMGWKGDRGKLKAKIQNRKEVKSQSDIASKEVKETFVRELKEKASKLLNSKDRSVSEMILSLGVNDPVMRNMIEKGLLDSKLLAWNLLNLRDHEFNNFVGMKKIFHKNDLQEHF